MRRQFPRHIIQDSLEVILIQVCCHLLSDSVTLPERVQAELIKVEAVHPTVPSELSMLVSVWVLVRVGM